MSNTPHDLYEDFPEKTDAIHALKAANAHFAKMVEEYHEVNRAVHRAETLIEPVSPEHESALRHKRMKLKDEIWKALSAA